jgi:putative Flp pilus-assembly TadE/G-like protein
MYGLLDRLRSEERGAVLVLVAMILPVFALFFVLTIEVGNWFEHRRHLQHQADAGVFAGAPLFNRCFSDDAGIRAASSAAIEATSLRFAGDPGTTNRFNAQRGLGSTGAVTVRFNKRDFERGGPSDTDTVELPACDAKMIDLKLTEADVPWFLRPATTLFAINAHARVEIQKLIELKGSLPVAIPDPNPRLVSVEFVNEGSGGAPCASPPCIAELEDNGIDEDTRMRNWGTSTPFTVTVPTGGMRIGVRVNLGGELSTTCGERLVECYDSESSNGLSFIRGYSTSGTPALTNPPLLRGVWPTSLTCTAPSFFYAPGGCSVGVEAVVDFGAPGDPTVAGILAEVEARVGGSAWQAMTWSAGVWTAAAGTFSVAGGSGPQVIDLRWARHAGVVGGDTCTTTGGNKCKGDFLNVQRVFSGSLDRSGSVRAIGISEGSGALPSSYALPPGDHELTVDVGTTYFHTAQDPTTDETVALRVASSSGSKNFAIDCDSGTNFRDEIAYGCYTPFGLNTDYPGCPRTTPNVPVDCVDVETGDKVGQLKQGMNIRFTDPATGACYPNNWATYPNLPTSDRRIVPLILTDFGAFTGSGGSPTDEVAVRRFASFYVTGWDGASCASNETYPFAGSEKGNIWGHFIIHIAPPTFGRGDPETRCQFNTEFDIDTCIAVLTR